MANERFYINIARQFGSLGRPIARELSALLGIEYYDRDIVEATAKEMGLTVGSIGEKDEEVDVFKFARMSLPLGSSSPDEQDKIFEAQRKVIINLADRGSCIFVGRCADHILREQPNCLNVFIYAPKEERYLNCVNSLNMKPAEAKRMIERVDKARDRYYQHYAGHKPSDLESCHLLVDSSMFGVKGTAEMLCGIARQRFQDML